MADANMLKIFKTGTGLTNAQKSTTTGIYQETRSAIDPDKIASRCPAIICNGAT